MQEEKIVELLQEINQRLAAIEAALKRPQTLVVGRAGLETIQSDIGRTFHVPVTPVLPGIVIGKTNR